MSTQQNQQQLTSAQMLRKMSARLGKALGVGAQATFAVLKSNQSPSDLILEYAIEETVRLQALAKSKKAPQELSRATAALKRVIDIALATDDRLTKQNELLTSGIYQHPDQQRAKTVSSSGAGPLAKDEEGAEVEEEQVEVAADPLDNALGGLAEMAGIEQEQAAAEGAEQGAEVEEEEEEELEAGAEGAAPAEKNYEVGEDGVPIDAPVSWGADLAKEAARDRKQSNAAILEKALKEGNTAVIAEYREKAKRRDGGLRVE